MSRNPSSSPSGSGGSSRSGSSKGTSAGSRAGSSGGSFGGNSGGNSGGSRMGTGVDGPGALPPQPRVPRTILAPAGQAAPGAGKPRPMLLALAVVGWTTFAVEWLVVLVIITQLGSQPDAALAQLPTSTPAPTPGIVPGIVPVPAPGTTPGTTPGITPGNVPVTVVTPPSTRPSPAPTPTAAAEGNPFRLTQTNVLGLTLPPGRSVILLDAIENTAPWLDDVKAAVVAGLAQSAGDSRQFRVVVTRNGQATAFRSDPVAPGPAQRSALQSYLNPLTPQGSGGLSSGLDAAIRTNSDHLIYITARSTSWDSYRATLESKLANNGNRVKLHVIQIGEVSPPLRAFVTGANGGTYLQLTPAQIKAWRAAAK